MVTYTIHIPPEGAARTAEGSEALVFVKDGFSWVALIIPMIWMIFRRMWWPLLGYLAAALVLQIAIVGAGLSEEAAFWALLLFALLFALEASSVRRWSLRRRGYQLYAVVSGHDRVDCETKALAAWLAETPVASPPSVKAAAAPPSPLRYGPQTGRPPATDDDAVIGMFPEPEPGR